MKMIDKAALVAEIKRQKGFIPECVNAFDEGEEHAYNQILSFINTIEAKEIGVDLGDPKGDKSVKYIIDTKTLEVKEVDVEKEFRSFLDDIEGMPRMWHSDEQLEWGLDIAKHFFELGMRSIAN